MKINQINLKYQSTAKSWFIDLKYHADDSNKYQSSLAFYIPHEGSAITQELYDSLEISLQDILDKIRESKITNKY